MLMRGPLLIRWIVIRHLRFGCRATIETPAEPCRVIRARIAATKSDATSARNTRPLVGLPRRGRVRRTGRTTGEIDGFECPLLHARRGRPAVGRELGDLSLAITPAIV